MVEVKQVGLSDDWITCIEYKEMALDYTVHTYIATGGSEPRRKSHYIHSIKFYDNEEEMPAEKED